MYAIFSTDGSFLPLSLRWGAGVNSKTSNKMWCFGGFTSKRGRIPRNGRHAHDIGCIEGYAILKSLDLAIEKALADINDRGDLVEPHEGKHLQKHPIIITDRTAVLGSLIKLVKKSGYVYGNIDFNHTNKPLNFRVILENLIVSLSCAVACFEYVTIVNNTTVPWEKTTLTTIGHLTNWHQWEVTKAVLSSSSIRLDRLTVPSGLWISR